MTNDPWNPMLLYPEKGKGGMLPRRTENADYSFFISKAGASAHGEEEKRQIFFRNSEGERANHETDD